MGTKFFAKSIINGDERIMEIPEHKVFDEAYRRFGYNELEGGISEALVWVQKVRSASKECPVVLTENEDKTIFVGIYAEG